MSEIGNRQIRTDLEMQVVARQKEIHLLFSERDQKGELVPAYTANFLLSPHDAIMFAGLVADLAYEEDTGLKPAGGGLKASLVERARVKLTQRVALMMRSMREDRTLSHQKVAQEIVDVCLREIYT